MWLTRGQILLVTWLGVLPDKLFALHFSDHCCLSKSAMIPCGFRGSHKAQSTVISSSRLILPLLTLLGRICNRATNLRQALGAAPFPSASRTAFSCPAIPVSSERCIFPRHFFPFLFFFSPGTSCHHEGSKDASKQASRQAAQASKQAASKQASE